MYFCKAGHSRHSCLLFLCTQSVSITSKIYVGLKWASVGATGSPIYPPRLLHSQFVSFAQEQASFPRIFAFSSLAEVDIGQSCTKTETQSSIAGYLRGCPPCSSISLGFHSLVALVCKSLDIRQQAAGTADDSLLS